MMMMMKSCVVFIRVDQRYTVRGRAGRIVSCVGYVPMYVCRYCSRRSTMYTYDSLQPEISGSVAGERVQEHVLKDPTPHSSD